MDPAPPLAEARVPFPLALKAELDHARSGVTTAVDRLRRELDAPAAAEEQALVAGMIRALEEVRQLEARLRKERLRRFAVRGYLEHFRAQFTQQAEALLEAFVSESEALYVPGTGELYGAESTWRRRLRLGLEGLRHDLATCIDQLPEEVVVPIELEAAEPKSDTPAPPLLQRLLERARAAGGLQKTELQLPLREAAELCLGAHGLDVASTFASAVAERRLATLRVVGHIVDATASFLLEQLFDVELGAEVHLDLAPMHARFVEGIEQLITNAHAREAELAAKIEQPLAKLAQDLEGQVERTGDAALAQTSESEVERAYRQRRDTLRALLEAPQRWDHDHRRVALRMLLQLEVMKLATAVSRSVHQLIHRLSRDLEPISAGLQGAKSVMGALLEALAEAKQAATPAKVREVIEQASTGLRGAWDQQLRRLDPQPLLEDLVTSLGAAAARQPASQGVDRARSAIRTLGPGYLLTTIAEPAKRVVGACPGLVTKSRAALVDGCSLLAAELDEALAASDDDELAETAEQLVVSIADSLERITQALDEVQRFRSFSEETLVSVTLIAIEGASLALEGELEKAGEGGAKEAQPGKRAAARLLGLFKQTRASAALRSSSRVAPPAGLVEELLRLREQLEGDGAVRSALPWVYQRLFARDALESPDFAVLSSAMTQALEQETEHAEQGGAVAILGARGSGKSTMAYLLARARDRGPLIRITPPPGGTAEPDVLFERTAAFAGDPSAKSTETALRSLPLGSTVCLDELGGWIERRPGGLSALSGWLELIRKLSDRLFFVMTATPRVWAYCDELAGISDRVAPSVLATPFSRAELEQALRLRQRTSGLELTFKTTRTTWRLETPRLPSGLLRRLLARTGGTIGDALDLWIHSVVGFDARQVELAIAQEPDWSCLLRLPLRWSAALLAFIFHGELNEGRAARVLRLPRDDTHELLAELRRAKLLEQDQQGALQIPTIIAPFLEKALSRRGQLPA